MKIAQHKARNGLRVCGGKGQGHRRAGQQSDRIVAEPPGHIGLDRNEGGKRARRQSDLPKTTLLSRVHGQRGRVQIIAFPRAWRKKIAPHGTIGQRPEEGQHLIFLQHRMREG